MVPPSVADPADAAPVLWQVVKLTAGWGRTPAGDFLASVVWGEGGSTDKVLGTALLKRRGLWRACCLSVEARETKTAKRL